MNERFQALIEEMVDRGIRYEDALREFERRFIARALSKCDGSVSATAETLGMHRNTLSRKIADYKLKRR